MEWMEKFLIIIILVKIVWWNFFEYIVCRMLIIFVFCVYLFEFGVVLKFEVDVDSILEFNGFFGE